MKQNQEKQKGRCGGEKEKKEKKKGGKGKTNMYKPIPQC